MKCEKKGNLVNRQVTVGQEDLEQINRLTRREFSQEELYCFRVVLCDNDVDRQMERFDEETLEQLARMFVGKTGICDHQPKTANQLARIYQAQVEYFPGKTNLLGEPYCAVVAKAYMVRTESNRDLILEIEAGIKKEVSVSCAVSRCVCSICGHDIHDRGLCSHVKGRTYEGKRCIARLADPTDAFEWSFVAVPAQPRAGVVKGFREAGTLEQLLSSLDQEGPWREELKALRRQAEMGRRYLDGLRQETVRLGLLAEEGLGGETLRAIADRLEEPELERLRACYARRLEEKLPMPVQLRYDGGETGPEANDGSFVI